MPSRVPRSPARLPGLTIAVAAPRARAESKAERDRFYASAAWRRLRFRFLARNPVCVDCLEEGIVTPATIAHHDEERLERPDRALDATNLVPLCSPCHTRRHKRRGPRDGVQA